MGWWDNNIPKITINNMTVGQVNKAVKAESFVIKLSKLLSALLSAIVAIVCTTYFSSLSTRA